MSNTFTEKYRLYRGEKLSGFQLLLKIGMPVFSEIKYWVLFFSIYGTVISLLYMRWQLPLLIPEDSVAFNTGLVVFNLGLSALLAFRTNTSHQRFWEARTLWGQLVNVSRNLARDICIMVQIESTKNRKEQENILLLIAAFAIALKLHLRAEPVNNELVSLMSKTQYSKLKYCVKHPPLQIARWIGNYLQSQYKHNRLNVYQVNDLHGLVDIMVNILGGCERILKTPQPIIYSFMLHKLVIVYCLLVPLIIVNDCHGFTSSIITFASIVLLGFEQIGLQLEQPFANNNPNTLPLDLICNTILSNIEELIESIEYTYNIDEIFRESVNNYLDRN